MVELSSQADPTTPVFSLSCDSIGRPGTSFPTTLSGELVTNTMPINCVLLDVRKVDGPSVLRYSVTDSSRMMKGVS